MTITPSVIRKQAVAEEIGLEHLEKALKSDASLAIKFGIDPTTADIHLGHAVPLRKLRQFQELGHHIYLVIGDFTATIGDPSGRSATRPVLTEAEVRQNMKTYLEQAGKILDLRQTHVVHNSEWLRNLSFRILLTETAKVSVNSLIDREDFAKRLKAGDPVSLNELLYPLAQAIDSIELKADVEIGGIDQKLNLLLARDLQRKSGQSPEALVMTRLLVGTDGSKKMSKSYGNYIAITEKPDQMFGKLMRIPDDQILEYGELAAWLDESSLKELRSLMKTAPRQAKAQVAQAVVALYWGQESAERSAANFNATFKDKQVADQLVQKVRVPKSPQLLWELVGQATETSRSAAQRLIAQGGVKLNGTVETDWQKEIKIEPNGTRLQVGKFRFFMLVLEK